jgi:hypothetical protein
LFCPRPPAAYESQERAKTTHMLKEKRSIGLLKGGPPVKKTTRKKTALKTKKPVHRYACRVAPSLCRKERPSFFTRPSYPYGQLVNLSATCGSIAIRRLADVRRVVN